MITDLAVYRRTNAQLLRRIEMLETVLKQAVVDFKGLEETLYVLEQFRHAEVCTLAVIALKVAI